MTPLPTARYDGPPDEKLFEAAAAYIEYNNAPPSSTYKHARVDLDGDGLKDGLVLFDLPHQSWCGWDGCSMAVFHASRNGFAPVASMSGIRGPLYVRQTKTNGWRDIVVRISGAEIRDKNVKMAFDGRSYPRHPMTAPTELERVSNYRGDVFFK